MIEKQFLEMHDWSFGSALSMFMMVIIVISIGLLNRIDPSKGERSGNW
jgi:spermidine/putrescine transport system permease protein